jgi:hypothetical protein
VIYVVAPTYERFSKWLRREMNEGDLDSTSEVKYVRDYHTLMGARLETEGDDIIFLPGWEDLPEARAIEEYAEMMRAEFPYRLTREGKKDQAVLRAEYERIRERMLTTKDPFVECE